MPKTAKELSAFYEGYSEGYSKGLEVARGTKEAERGAWEADSKAAMSRRAAYNTPWPEATAPGSALPKRDPWLKVIDGGKS